MLLDFFFPLSYLPRDRECISKVPALAVVWHHSKPAILLCGNSPSWAVGNCAALGTPPRGAARGGRLGLPPLHPHRVRVPCLCFGGHPASLSDLVSVLLTPPTSTLPPHLHEGWGLTPTPRHIRRLAEASVGAIRKLAFHKVCAGPFALRACLLLPYFPSTLVCIPGGRPLQTAFPQHPGRLASSWVGPVEGPGVD